MKYQLPLVLYDPECPLCLRFKQGLEYLGKDIHFISARDEDIYSNFPDLSRQDCLERVHMITLEGKVLQGPEVVDELVKHIPGVSKLAWLLENDQAKKVKEFFFQKVEELREMSQKSKKDCNQCPREN